MSPLSSSIPTMLRAIAAAALWLMLAMQFSIHAGCGEPVPPRPEDSKAIYALWNDQGKGWIRLGVMKDFKPEIFPLQIAYAPMTPDSYQPNLANNKIATISWEERYRDIEVNKFPNEAGIVLFDNQGNKLDWVTYVTYPDNSVLVRTVQKERFCQQTSFFDKEQSSCQEVSRTKDIRRIRHIRSLDELLALTQTYGLMGLQTQVVKFSIDTKRDDTVHFFSAKQWSLHFTYVYEVIEGNRHLDTCDPKDLEIWSKAYNQFITDNYYVLENRRYLSGFLMIYPGDNLYSIEFSTSDKLSGQDMARVYQRARRVLDQAIPLKLRPVSQEQKQRLATIPDPKPPIMDEDAPYSGATMQLLSPGIAYGTLRSYTNASLPTATLGLREIALLQEVPNNINFVGGIISTQFQSTLSHINVLSRNRGTPHLVIREPLKDSKIASLLDKLVRLEVTEDGYSLRAATLQEAEEFWKKKEGEKKPYVPPRNLATKDLMDLSKATVQDVATIGAKAANLAELGRVDIAEVDHIPACKELLSFGKVKIPQKPFAIPFYWYMDHLQRAKLVTQLNELHKNQRFLKDPLFRREELKKIQTKILETSVNSELETMLMKELESRYGRIKVRFRSSTNVEDLPTFNGAGLYQSVSVRLRDSKRRIDDGLRKVWASLWSERAWNERAYHKVDHLNAAMGILVHPSFTDEEANGVAVSTNAFLSGGTSSEIYIVTQRGEVSVVNPPPRVVPEQVLIRWHNPPQLIYLTYCSINQGKTLLTRQEAVLLGCYMRAIKSHFAPLLAQRGIPFAMESEFKLDGTPRQLIIKQARPYILGEDPRPPRTCK